MLTDANNARREEPTGPMPASGMAALVAIALVAVGLRVVGLGSRSLWYDELQSVTHAYLSLDDLLTSMSVFDPHPPFYYIQLHFWMRLGTGDAWIRLNGVMWSVLGVASLYFVARTIFGTRVAIMAAALLAIFPCSVAYAQEARMYALLMFLAVWHYFFTHRFLVGVRPWPAGAGLLLVSLAFLYSHGAGFLLLSAGLAYALLAQVSDETRNPVRLLTWGLLQIGIVALYLPWLSQARTIEVGHAQAPNAAQIAQSLFELVFGFGRGYPDWLRMAGGILVAVMLCAAVLHSRDSRTVAIGYVLAPLVAAALISHLVRPIWLVRTLAFTTPFFALAFACVLDDAFRRMAARRQSAMRSVTVTSGAVAALLLIALTVQQRTYTHPWNFRDAAAYVRSETGPADLVYVPNIRSFWVFNWYFLGPGSVNPLTTMYRQTAEGGATVIAQPAVDGSTFEASAPWIVYRGEYDDIAPFAKETQTQVHDFDGLMVAEPALP